MNKLDTLNLAFSLNKMYNDTSYNATLYDYKVPKRFKKQKEIFESQNSYVLYELQQYNKNNTLVRLIINYWLLNDNKLKNISNNDYHLFVSSLLEYKNELALFIDNNSNLSASSLYKMYIKKEIPFYVFFYVCKYVKFKESFIGNVLIKNKIKQVRQLFYIFKHFDEVYIKEQLKQLQKKVTLSGN